LDIEINPMPIDSFPFAGAKLGNKKHRKLFFKKMNEAKNKMGCF
jgi:hypothetical protein